MMVDPLLTLKLRLKRIGIYLELFGNYPWIYLESVNGNRVIERSSDSNHGFTIAFLSVRDASSLKLVNTKEMFELIRKYR